MLNERDGVIRAAARRICAEMDEMKVHGWSYHATCSALEIYNNGTDQLRDLLQSDATGTPALSLHEDANGAVHVDGLSAQPFTSAAHIDQVISIAIFNRCAAKRVANEASSRSHMLLSFFVSGSS